MRALRRLLPSLNHLYVFEAAARLGSFSAAANELGVSQPAVSNRIRHLESELGAVLFYRERRGISLTAQGEAFFRDTSLALSQVLVSVQGLSAPQVDDSSVTLAVSTAFATYYLLPRTRALRLLHPGITLQVQATDAEVDLDGGGFDIAILLGRGPWPGHDVAAVAPERIRPVASPTVVEALGGPLGLSDLAQAPLLHLFEPYEHKRMSWPSWFELAGSPVRELPPPTLAFNDYQVILQAAMTGEGIALGWTHIVDDLVQQGLLAWASDIMVETDHPFCIVQSKDRLPTPSTQLVTEWLINEMASTRSEVI